MRDARQGIWSACVAVVVVTGSITAGPRESFSESGPPFHTLLELETSARLLAILLDSGRAVVNENPDWFDPSYADSKPDARSAFEQQLVDLFRTRTGIDLRDLASSRIPEEAKQWLRIMLDVSKQVAASPPADLSRKDLRFAGLIPAVFGARVAGRFSELTGVRLKQTALAPRNPANAPDPFEMAALKSFADSTHPREQSISEVTTTGRSLRLMYPLYMTRQCLVCHGEPKGERDKTGYPREGVQLGQSAGAISVVIPLHK
jgi:general secretion pathway protein A